MEQLIHDLLSPSNGFVAIAFVIASWALRRFVKTVDDLEKIIEELAQRVAELKEDHGERIGVLEYAAGIGPPLRRKTDRPPKPHAQSERHD